MLAHHRLYLKLALFSVCSLAALPLLVQAAATNLAALKLSHRLAERFPEPSYWYIQSFPVDSLSSEGNKNLPAIFGNRTGNNSLDRLAGIDRFANGQWADAEYSFRTILSSDPYDVGARFWLGHSLIRQGKSEAAIREWSQLGAGLPLVYAGEHKLKAGQTEDGLTWIGLGLLVAQASPPSPAASQAAGLAYHHFAEFYRHRGDVSSTILNLEKALAYLPNRVDFRYDLAQLYLRKSRFEDALAQMELAEKLFPGSAITSGIRGEIYLQSGDLIRAEEAFRECLARKFDQYWHARAYFGLSNIYSRWLDWEESISTAHQAIELHAGIDPGWESQLDQNFQAALNAEPDHLEWYLRIGDLYRKAGEPSQARIYYELARSRWPENRAVIERLK